MRVVRIHFTMLLTVFVLFGCASYQPKASVKFTGRAATWPIEFVENGLACVRASIGNNVGLMGIDTGLIRQQMSIKPTLLSLACARKTEHSVLLLDAMNGTFQREYYQRLATVEIGDITFTDVEVIPEKREYVPTDVDGLIGLGLLKQFNLMIDYRKRTIDVYPSDRQPLEVIDWHKMKFTLDAQQGIILVINAQGHSYNMLLDTGAWNPDDNSVISIRKQRNKVVGEHAIEFLAGEMSIGEYTVDALFGSPVSFDGVLGASFFFKNKVYIDFTHSEIWFVEQEG